MLSRPLRIGTRGSPLALAQANLVAGALRAVHGLDEAAVEIVAIRTTGDRIQDRPLADLGGKALWTKELDRALAEGETDLSVHSMKDVESVRPEWLHLAGVLPRADVRDRLIGAASVDEIVERGRVGTSSPRRAAQLRRLRPDLRIVPIRGNVATRLTKLRAGECDATMLAAAGLDRLGHAEVGVAVAVEVMLPAAAQGAIGVEVRADDADVRAMLGRVTHPATCEAVAAERAVLAALGGNCHAPAAVLAEVDADGVRVRAQILSEDGAECAEADARIAAGDRDAATAIAADLLARAPDGVRRHFAGA